MARVSNVYLPNIAGSRSVNTVTSVYGAAYAGRRFARVIVLPLDDTNGSLRLGFLPTVPLQTVHQTLVALRSENFVWRE